MRRLRIFLWSAVVLVGAVLITAYSLGRFSWVPESEARIAIGGPFSMTDHNGRSVTEKDFAGKARAMFFGFTFCPDVCPTTLTRLSNLIGQLGTRAEKISVILVSVDPERDSPEVLKNYLSFFDRRFVGLTGTPEQLQAFARNYKVFYEKVPSQDGSYTMNHTAGILLFDETGEFRGTLDAHEPDATALTKLENLIH